MKIGIITGGNFQAKKGLFNSVHCRAKELMQHPNIDVDIYFLEEYPSLLFKLIFKAFRPNATLDETVDAKEVIYKGVKYHILRTPKLIIDYILSVKLHFSTTISKIIERKKMSHFREYDIIIAQSTTGAHLAKLVHHKYNIPYIAVWHGSDINYTPLESKYKFKEVSSYIHNAAYNVYVSNALKNTAVNLFGDHKSCVIYNGVQDVFMVSPNKEEICKTYNSEKRTIVAFVGGLLEVKNIEVLAPVFKEINSKISNCQFWIIGDGKLRHSLLNSLNDVNIDYKFWGNVEQNKMADLYNCIDLLVLPSKNEGLPLVVLEAMACGCKVVTSDVGGISEVLPAEYVVPLNQSFVQNFSQRCIETLIENNEQFSLSKDFSWDTISEQEYELIKFVLNNH